MRCTSQFTNDLGHFPSFTVFWASILEKKKTPIHRFFYFCRKEELDKLKEKKKETVQDSDILKMINQTKISDEPRGGGGMEIVD